MIDHEIVRLRRIVRCADISALCYWTWTIIMTVQGIQLGKFRLAYVILTGLGMIATVWYFFVRRHAKTIIKESENFKP